MSLRRPIKKPIFTKKQYSFRRDFLYLILTIALLLIVFNRLEFVSLLDINKSANKNITAVFKVDETNGQQQKKYVLKIWVLKGKTYVEVADFDTIKKYFYSENELFEESQGKVKRLGKAINPFFFPYTNYLLEFIKRNSTEFRNLKLKEGFIHLGRRCLLTSFKDPFKKNRFYEFLLDEETGFPLSIEVKDEERIIYKSNALEFSDNVNLKEKPFLINVDKAVDAYPGLILEANEVQNLATFAIYPPTWVPPELNQMKIVKLNKYKAPFSTLEIKKDLILFSFYNNNYFVHVVESKGKFNLSPLKKGKPFIVNGRKFNTAALPCALAAWTQDGNTFLLIVSNIDKNKIIKVAKGLFE